MKKLIVLLTLAILPSLSISQATLSASQVNELIRLIGDHKAQKEYIDSLDVRLHEYKEVVDQQSKELLVLRGLNNELSDNNGKLKHDLSEAIQEVETQKVKKKRRFWIGAVISGVVVEGVRLILK